MIFIVGGRAQGKTAFARTYLKGTGEGIADGRTDPPERAFEAPLVLHLEWFVRQILEEKGDLAAFLDRLIRENPDAVVTADEIGCGIVPADPFLRAWREEAGRAGQRIAARSEQVYRVICGLGNRIK